VSAATEKSDQARMARRRVCAFCCALLLVFGCERPLRAAQQDIAQEYVWKANFLAKSASFVEWQIDSPLQAANVFRWCVYGNFSFGTALAEMTRDIVVDGKRSEVKWVHKEAELASCHIVFVSRSEEKHYAKILDAARPGRALTVGETPTFLEAGGMVALLMDGKTPQFEVNLEPVSACRMKLSSRMLSLARRVVNQATAAKG
jgi:uncharacterized protein DUF4154